MTRELTIRIYVDGVQVSEKTTRYKNLDWQHLITFVAWRPWHVRFTKLGYRIGSFVAAHDRPPDGPRV